MQRLHLKLNCLIASLLILNSCNIVLDQSALAFESNDQTLIHSACKAAPSGGIDVCRIVEGAKISEEWDMIVPHMDKFISGEMKIMFRDQVKSYSVNGNIVRVPWADIIGHDSWEIQDSGPVQALGSFQYQGPAGPVFIDILGTAVLIVLKKGYTPMPIDSGAQMGTTDCKIQYSSAGRSAINCK